MKGQIKDKKGQIEDKKGQKIKDKISEVKRLISLTKAMKENSIENYLRLYKTYQICIKNCEKQIEYIMPSLVTKYGIDENGAYFFIVNDTEKVAIDRIESKRALDLKEQIERYSIITSSIENALSDLKQHEQDFVRLRYFERLSIHEVKLKMRYSEDKSIYRIRRNVLDKLIISLQNLFSLS